MIWEKRSTPFQFINPHLNLKRYKNTVLVGVEKNYKLLCYLLVNCSFYYEYKDGIYKCLLLIFTSEVNCNKKSCFSFGNSAGKNRFQKRLAYPLRLVYSSNIGL